MMQEGFIYKEFTEEYTDQLIELWNQHSGWGLLDKTTFLNRLKTPNGRLMISIIVNREGNIVGHIINTPSLVWNGKKQIKAIRVSAPILHSEIREYSVLDPRHPIWPLVKKSFDIAADKGFKLVYSFPESSWTRPLGRGNHYGIPKFITKRIPYYKIGSAKNNLVSANLKVRVFSAFKPRHEKVWEKLKRDINNEFAVERTANWLNFRVGDDLKLECYENGNLIGFAVFLPKSKILYDIVAMNRSSIHIVIQECLRFLCQSEYAGHFPVIKFLGTDTLLYALRNYNIETIDYIGSFVYGFLDSDLHRIDPPSITWYNTSLD